MTGLNPIQQLSETLNEGSSELNSILAIDRRLTQLHSMGKKGSKYPDEFYRLKNLFKKKLGHEWTPR